MGTISESTEKERRGQHTSKKGFVVDAEHGKRLMMSAELSKSFAKDLEEIKKIINDQKVLSLEDREFYKTKVKEMEEKTEKNITDLSFLIEKFYWDLVQPVLFEKGMRRAIKE